jgi:hypothetical protein
VAILPGSGVGIGIGWGTVMPPAGVRRAAEGSLRLSVDEGALAMEPVAGRLTAAVPGSLRTAAPPAGMVGCVPLGSRWTRGTTWAPWHFGQRIALPAYSGLSRAW